MMEYTLIGIFLVLLALVFLYAAAVDFDGDYKDCLGRGLFWLAAMTVTIGSMLVEPPSVLAVLLVILALVVAHAFALECVHNHRKHHARM